ncbi:hypothetical protein DL95DRAFT_390158 [Leptodontidium sp. 2 PMI_412]|nr:hypothetical protein DL95DRAFT_390158 [Leptodontidium sp. 2 PMI_412]
MFFDIRTSALPCRRSAKPPASAFSCTMNSLTQVQAQATQYGPRIPFSLPSILARIHSRRVKTGSKTHYFHFRNSPASL